MENQKDKARKTELEMVFEALYGRSKDLEGYEEDEYDDDDADCIVLSD